MFSFSKKRNKKAYFVAQNKGFQEKVLTLQTNDYTFEFFI